MQELTRYLEKAKQKLALAVDFNLGDLFKFFVISDVGNPHKGFIDQVDVARVARYLRVMPSDSNEESLTLINAFVRSLDGDGDGQLLFTDLSRGFLPSSNEEYQKLVVDRPTFYDRANY